MHGDYSRMTYAPSRHYSGVVAQQGRFMLDAELNEQALIVNDYLRRLTTDLVGPFAGPAHHTGFAVEPLSENGKAWGVELSRGHYYVYGLRCEAPAAGSDDGPIRIGEHTPPFIVFIAVWEQSIGAVQDPGLIEPALGPHVPDTTRRLQVRWRPHAAAKLPGTEDLTGLDRNGIAEAFHAYNSDQDRRARLGARTHPGHAADADPSSSPVAAGYSGLENQLYRVEIHHGGDAERATFKWSRDNGSVEIALEGLSGIDEHGLRTATIAPGRHEPRRGLAQGDWVELVDDGWVPYGTPPPLMRVHQVLLAKRQVMLQDTHSDRDFDRGSHPFLRLWDQQPDSATAQRGLPVALADGKWFDLEDGVQTLFERDEAEYERGDYWLIPARTEGEHGVLWPQAGDDPLAVAPHGPARYLAPLALVEELPGTPRDLRIQFTHLSDEPAATAASVRPTFTPGVTVTPSTAPITRPSLRHQLRSISAERAGEVFDLYDGLTVGRGPECGIHFDLIDVSRHHAQFGVDAGGVTIMDLGSSNGTKLNGARIAARVPRRLSPGDTIQLTEAVQLRLEEH